MENRLSNKMYHICNGFTDFLVPSCVMFVHIFMICKIFLTYFTSEKVNYMYYLVVSRGKIIYLLNQCLVNACCGLDTMHVARDTNMTRSQPPPCGRVFTAEWEGGCKQIITAV